MKKILVTGLCTLHWGRLQYGNIGNYYIIEPLFRLLHKYFTGYEIVTTFQMDQKFVDNEKITVVPMDLYYSWSDDDIKNVEADLESAKAIKDGTNVISTPYVDLVNECEYIINVSGDMWGHNAEHVGHLRFYVDCLKMKVAQLLGKKTILYAVTPGPFDDAEYDLAKDVFSGFDLVLVREKISLSNLKKWGMPLNNVEWAPCPSFLFESNTSYKSVWTDEISKRNNKIIGMTFGGFNMPVGPYDMWPRSAEQYDGFIEIAEHIMNDFGADICLFSHTNGFELPPNFKLINGRDFIILKLFYEVLISKNAKYKDKIILINEPLLPCDIKAVIGRFDMLVTGRVHASVAATSQCVPTVFMEYDGRVIYSDKMLGFSRQISMERFVCSPEDITGIKTCVDNCFKNLESVRNELCKNIEIIKKCAEAGVKRMSQV